MDEHATPGTVYLVGAGPGDPELITVRGQRVLQQADVVLHDRLVHPDLVAERAPESECIYVGKTPGGPSWSQDEINDLLIEKARQGDVVVRLKGGDPFVFGRGGEECMALREAGVAYEVVPGVTSATGVPAGAGIPLTHRHTACAFTVVTGHTCNGDRVNWSQLTNERTTLVILMGLRKLGSIADALVSHGRAPDTPVAVVRAGSTAAEEVVRGTLATIANRVQHLTPPATAIVGDVAALPFYQGGDVVRSEW